MNKFLVVSLTVFLQAAHMAQGARANPTGEDDPVAPHVAVLRAVDPASVAATAGVSSSSVRVTAGRGGSSFGANLQRAFGSSTGVSAGSGRAAPSAAAAVGVSDPVSVPIAVPAASYSSSRAAVGRGGSSFGANLRRGLGRPAADDLPAGSGRSAPSAAAAGAGSAAPAEQSISERLAGFSAKATARVEAVARERGKTFGQINEDLSRLKALSTLHNWSWIKMMAYYDEHNKTVEEIEEIFASEPVGEKNNNPFATPMGARLPLMLMKAGISPEAMAAHVAAAAATRSAAAGAGAGGTKR